MTLREFNDIVPNAFKAMGVKNECHAIQSVYGLLALLNCYSLLTDGNCQDISNLDLEEDWCQPSEFFDRLQNHISFKSRFVRQDPGEGDRSIDDKPQRRPSLIISLIDVPSNALGEMLWRISRI